MSIDSSLEELSQSSKSDNVRAGAFIKQEQILQGATRVFLKHGYAGTSMDRVAAEAGVSKQTIYSYFQDKEGLFTALIERVTIRQIRIEYGPELFQGEPADLLRRIAQGFLTKRAIRSIYLCSEWLWLNQHASQNWRNFTRVQ